MITKSTNQIACLLLPLVLTACANSTTEISKGYDSPDQYIGTSSVYKANKEQDLANGRIPHQKHDRFDKIPDLPPTFGHFPANKTPSAGTIGVKTTF